MLLHHLIVGHHAVQPGVATEAHQPGMPSRRTCRVLPILLLAAVLAGVTWHALGPGWTLEAGLGGSGLMGLALLCATYALLLALPFVPAVEIGLLVMLLFGKAGAVIAWLATLVGLNIAFAVGRRLGRCAGNGEAVRLPRAISRRLERLEGTRWQALVPVLTLAFLLNVPGNTAIGGGGGIAMLYGATRTLSWPMFALTVAAATCVIPLLFVLGLVGLEPLVESVMAATPGTDGQTGPVAFR